MTAPGFGPFNLIPRAPTGVYRSFCSLVDNGSSAPGFPTTVTWDVDSVVATPIAPQFSPMAFNTQGTGTFTSTSWAAGPFPQGQDGYILIEEQISGNYTAGNWIVSIGVVAATATCDGAGNPVVRLYSSPNQGGQTSTSIDNWKEVTGVPVTLSGWSNLTTATIQDCTATFNPGALDFNGQTLCLRVEMELTATTTNAGAQVTIVNDPAHSFLRPPAASFTPKPVGRMATVAKAAGFTWPNYPITLHGPFLPGDVWYFGILRVQSTPPPVGNDVLAVTETNSINIVQNTKDSFSDSNANLTDIWSGTINASVSDITISAQLDVQDMGAIVEIQAAAYRNYTGAGHIIVDASFNHGNAIGSPEQTFQGSMLLTGAPAIIYQYATGQAGNWAPDPTRDAARSLVHRRPVRREHRPIRELLSEPRDLQPRVRSGACERNGPPLPVPVRVRTHYGKRHAGASGVHAIRLGRYRRLGVGHPSSTCIFAAWDRNRRRYGDHGLRDANSSGLHSIGYGRPALRHADASHP